MAVLHKSWGNFLLTQQKGRVICSKGGFCIELSDLGLLAFLNLSLIVPGAGENSNINSKPFETYLTSFFYSSTTSHGGSSTPKDAQPRRLHQRAGGSAAYRVCVSCCRAVIFSSRTLRFPRTDPAHHLAGPFMPQTYVYFVLAFLTISFTMRL